MKLTVNGDKQELAGDVISITDLLAALKVESPDMVSVQLNQEFVDRENYNDTQVRENDEVDFLYFMGGGAS